MSSELVIVYHRQPYEEVEEDGRTVFRENKSPNGIVPTLKSFFGSVDHGGSSIRSRNATTTTPSTGPIFAR